MGHSRALGLIHVQSFPGVKGNLVSAGPLDLVVAPFQYDHQAASPFPSSGYNAGPPAWASHAWTPWAYASGACSQEDIHWVLEGQLVAQGSVPSCCGPIQETAQG